MKHFYCMITPYFELKRNTIFGMKLIKFRPIFVFWYSWKNWTVDFRKDMYGDI